MEMTTKSFVLNPETGGDDEIIACIGKIGVIDSQRDMLMPGSIAPHDTQIGAWGHASLKDSAPPIGVGKVAIDQDLIVLKGTFDQDQASQDARAKIKRRGPAQEWSGTFLISKSDKALDSAGKPYR